MCVFFVFCCKVTCGGVPLFGKRDNRTYFLIAKVHFSLRNGIVYSKNAYFAIMNNRINEIQDEIIDEFSGFSDWMDKYSYIIEMGNALPPIDERHKTPDNIIEGCQSRVWLNAEYRDGKIHFEADSDAIIVKGIISMLVRVLSDQTPADILDANLYFIDSIGLTEHLSPTRSNGLLAMVKQIKMYALAYKTKEQQQQ